MPCTTPCSLRSGRASAAVIRRPFHRSASKSQLPSLALCHIEGEVQERACYSSFHLSHRSHRSHRPQRETRPPVHVQPQVSFCQLLGQSCSSSVDAHHGRRGFPAKRTLISVCWNVPPWHRLSSTGHLHAPLQTSPESSTTTVLHCV